MESHSRFGDAGSSSCTGKNTSLRIARDAILQDGCLRLKPVPLTRKHIIENQFI